MEEFAGAVSVVVVEEEEEEDLVVAVVGEVELGRDGAGVWLGVLSVMEAIEPARAQSPTRAGRVGLYGRT